MTKHTSPGLALLVLSLGAIYFPFFRAHIANSHNHWYFHDDARNSIPPFFAFSDPALPREDYLGQYELSRLPASSDRGSQLRGDELDLASQRICASEIRPLRSFVEVGAKFELRCCGYCEDEDSHVAVAGHEAQGEYMFD